EREGPGGAVEEGGEPQRPQGEGDVGRDRSRLGQGTDLVPAAYSSSITFRSSSRTKIMSASSSGSGQSLRIERRSHCPFTRERTKPLCESKVSRVRAIELILSTGFLSSGSLRVIFSRWRASLRAMRPFFARWLTPSSRSTSS